MRIHYAPSCRSKEWKPLDISFNKFYENYITRPIHTSETVDEYFKLSKEEQDEIKDVGGYVGGSLRDNRRSKKSVRNRTLIALDADKIESYEQLQSVLDHVRALGFSCCWHTTRKHSHDKPRIRIIFNLDKAIEPQMYEPIVRALCSLIGMEIFDGTCVQKERLMYFPSISCDGTYECEQIDGILLDGEKFLKETYDNYLDIAEWKLFPQESKIIHSESKEVQDPREKRGAIGTFCRTYTISDVIDIFLPDIYRPSEKYSDRYSYNPGTATDGLLVQDDILAYSFDDTDPARVQHKNNAYDLVRIHKFGNTKDSMEQMNKFIENDPKYREQRREEEREKFNKIEMTDEEKENVDLLTEGLERNLKTGLPKATINNFYLVLTLDPKLCGKYYFDIFANKRIIHKKLPWHNEEDALPRLWVDSDDSNLRHYIESEYHFKNAAALADAINKVFYERMVHPVREYLNDLKWDGVKRVDTLLIDYFGAEDNVYTREAISKTLLAAIARIYKPGTKFDNVPILKGEQGTGKSTFIRILASDEWFTDSLTRFDGKEASELLENKWIIELGELKGLYRKEIEQAKQFFSKTSDQYRSAYARHPEEHPRQCVFIGTTNNETFLNDRTGNRRFWPIGLGKRRVIKSVFKDLKDERDQIWAETKDWYDRLVKADPSRDLLNQTLLLTEEAEKLANIERESRMEDDPRYGEIIEFIKREIPATWNSYDFDRRKDYWLNYNNATEKKVKRSRICAREILRELYDADNRNVKEDTKEINSLFDSMTGLKRYETRRRCGPYGKQNCYEVTQLFFDTYRDEVKQSTQVGQTGQ